MSIIAILLITSQMILYYLEKHFKKNQNQWPYYIIYGVRRLLRLIDGGFIDIFIST